MAIDKDAVWMTPKEMAKDRRDFLTVSQTAERAEVSQATVRLALRRGELTRYRCGHLIYVCWSEVLAREPHGSCTKTYVGDRLVRTEVPPLKWHTMRNTGKTKGRHSSLPKEAPTIWIINRSFRF